MSDQCDLTITMRLSDVPRFAPFVGRKELDVWWDEVDDDCAGQWIRLRVEGVNYGWLAERQAAADAGITFVGEHGPGDGYGSYAFAAHDGNMREAMTCGGQLVIGVDEDFKPTDDPQGLRDYVALRRAAEIRLGLRKAA